MQITCNKRKTVTAPDLCLLMVVVLPMLGIEPRALQVQGEFSTTQLHPSLEVFL